MVLGPGDRHIQPTLPVGQANIRLAHAPAASAVDVVSLQPRFGLTPKPLTQLMRRNQDAAQRRLLAAPVVKMPDREYTYLEFLRMMESHMRFQTSLKETRLLTAIVLMGLPLVSKSFRASMHVQSVPIVHELDVRSEFNHLTRYSNYSQIVSGVSLACDEMSRKKLIQPIPERAYMWMMNETGLQLLRRYEGIPHWELEVHHMNALKTLVTETQDGWNGLELLKQVEDLFQDKQRSFRGIMSSGMSEKELLRRLPTRDPKGVQAQIQALIYMGLLTREDPLIEDYTAPPKEKRLLHISDWGKDVLKEGNLLKSGVVTQEDLKNIVKDGIQQLKAEKRQRERAIQEIDKLYFDNAQSLEVLRTKKEKAEQAALALYDQHAQATKSKERETLRIQLTQRAEESDALEAEIALQEESLSQLKTELSKANLAYQSWNRKNQTAIKDLTVTLHRLENAPLAMALADLIQDLNPDAPRQQAESDSMTRLLAVLNISLGFEDIRPYQPS